MNMLQDVKDFQRKFDLGEHPSEPVMLLPVQRQQRLQLLQEELSEFSLACGTGGFAPDLAEQADALVDLVYVALGTAALMGLPWEKLWADVHRANMAKVRGMTKRGHTNDVMKPEGWVGPQTEKILLEATTHD